MGECCLQVPRGRSAQVACKRVSRQTGSPALMQEAACGFPAVKQKLLLRPSRVAALESAYLGRRPADARHAHRQGRHRGDSPARRAGASRPTSCECSATSPSPRPVRGRRSDRLLQPDPGTRRGPGHARPCRVIAHCHLGLGRLNGRAGKQQPTREHFATAAAIYRDMDMPFWMEQAEAPDGAGSGGRISKRASARTPGTTERAWF
jgi:hypothetical protein